MNDLAHIRGADEHHHDERARLARLAYLLVPDHGFAWGRCVLSILLMLVVVVGTVGGALYWRLGKDPMAVPYLTDEVQASLADKLPPGYALTLGRVSLQRRDGRLAAVLDDLVLRDASGGVVASAPRIIAGVGLSGLLGGTLALRTIVVEGASATLIVDPSGRISLRAGGDAMSPLQNPGEMTVPAMINAFDALLVAAGTIDAVELRGASLVIHDKAIGRDADYRGIGLSIRRTSVDGGLAVALATGGGSVNATIEKRQDGARLIDVQAKEIGLRNLVTGFTPGAKPPDLAATINVLARAKLDSDGTISQASLNLTNGGGRWRIDPTAPPFLFDEARLDLRWDAAAGEVFVDRAMLRSGSGVGSFQGRMSPPSTASDGNWMIELDAPGMTLSGPNEQDPPLQLDRASIRARYNPLTRRLGLDKGVFSGPTAGVVVAGSATFGKNTPGIGLGLEVDRMSVTALKRLWPFFAVPAVRDWFQHHMTGGTVESGKLSLAIAVDALTPVDGVIPPLPAGAVSGDVVVSDGGLALHDTLPPITGAAIHASFNADRVTVGLSSGRVDLGDAGVLTLADGLYEIPDLDVKPPRQQVSFDLSGPTKAVASLMGREPLAKASAGVPLDPATVTGTAALEVKLDMPLLPAIKDSDIRYAITGTLEGMTTGGSGFGGGKLEDGTLKLSIEPGVMLVTGKGQFSGLPARIDYRQATGETPQIAMTVTIDDAARKKKGLDFGDALDGPITAEVRPSQGSYTVDVDLAPARIRDLLPGWQKPPGRPGTASFTWTPQGAGGQISDLKLESGPVSLRGDVTLGADGKLRRAALSGFRLSPGDDVQGSLEAFGQGWKAVIRGRSLDLRPLLKALQQGGTGKAGDLTLDARLDQALGFGDETLSGLAVSLETKSSTIRRVDLKGRLGGGDLTVAQPAGTASQVVLDTSDAGSLLRFLDYYGRINGGTMRLVSTPTLNDMSGRIAMRDFSVRDEPALGRYRSSLQQSPDARDRVALPENGNSAKFRKLGLAFRRTPDRIDISDAVVWGADVGVSISGLIDYAADRVAMTGTFVPAYAVNNLFGKIPILGEILGGGENGGLFAINFKVSGRIAAPVLTINPLSAIAPGFLRKLFAFQQD